MSEHGKRQHSITVCFGYDFIRRVGSWILHTILLTDALLSTQGPLCRIGEGDSIRTVKYLVIKQLQNSCLALRGFAGFEWGRCSAGAQ
jgi:hypothetical protein